MLSLSFIHIGAAQWLSTWTTFQRHDTHSQQQQQTGRETRIIIMEETAMETKWNDARTWLHRRQDHDRAAPAGARQAQLYMMH